MRVLGQGQGEPGAEHLLVRGGVLRRPLFGEFELLGSEGRLVRRDETGHRKPPLSEANSFSLNPLRSSGAEH
jgi:hypothetical protein